jgi:hypothetical protein
VIETGTIVEVEVETKGSELSADVAVGATVLHVRSTIDFSDLGGSVTLGVETITYAEDAVDDDALTVTLDTPLVSGYTESEFVYVAPAPIVTYWAHVQLDQESDEVILAELSRPLAAMIVQGNRDDDEQESAAVLEERDGDWIVVDVLGLKPTLVGAAIYVPDLETPQFQVDEAGHMIANSVEIQSQDDVSIPLSIFDRDGTSTPWTVWMDQLLRTYFRVTAAGFEAQTPGSFAAYDTLGDNFPRVKMDDVDGVGFGPGGDLGLDVYIHRSGPSQIEVDDQGAPADLKVTGELIVDDTGWLDLITRASAPVAPNPGRLRVYVTTDGSGHPQIRVKNSNATVATLTTFADGA